MSATAPTSREPPQSKARNLKLLKESQQNRLVGTPVSKLLVLVGIPGSGKSTFAASMRSIGFEVICQDELGDRKICESRTVQALLNNRNVVIDRCNFDVAQRKHWVDYGNAYGSQTGVVVFGTPLDECVRRVRERTGHKTLGGGGAGDSVVMRMSRSFVFPTQAEGFGFCRVIRGEADEGRVWAEMEAWVKR